MEYGRMIFRSREILLVDTRAPRDDKKAVPSRPVPSRPVPSRLLLAFRSRPVPRFAMLCPVPSHPVPPLES